MIEDLISGLFDLVLLAFRRRRQKAEEWRGILEEKRSTGGHSIARKTYRLYFRTESGKRKKIRVGEADFALFEKGQNYQKNRGEILPDPNSAI
jgi:hypothetical protein